LAEELKTNKMKRGPFKMKGYSYPGTSPVKHSLSIPSEVNPNELEGTKKEKDAKKHNKRHTDGLPSDHGLTPEQNKRINP